MKPYGKAFYVLTEICNLTKINFMKRLSFLSLSLTLFAAAAIAVPAKRGQWKTLRLADGTEVRAELRGDEFAHYYRTADGDCYVRDYDASTTAVYKAIDLQQIKQQAKAARIKVSETQAARRANAAKKTTLGGTHDEFKGTKKCLILLVQFSDKKFADGHDNALYQRIANEENFNYGSFVGSVRDYYYAQSGGQFTINFDIIGPITLSKSYSYYGGDNSYWGKDYNVRVMVSEALNATDSEVNYADYDWDGDGTVEQVFLLYAGRGQASGGGDDTIWPHMSNLYKALTLDGVKLSTYACSNELQDDTNIDGIGPFCHEFSHCMGLPDTYDTDSDNFGMSAWDVMDQGNYNGSAFIPAAYTAYERMYCGWQQPTELTDGMEVSGMKPIADGGNFYVIHNSGNSNEYYLFENRQLTGWDAGLYGKGLLVTHVDFDSKVWELNCVNTITTGNNDHLRCTILHADNNDTETINGLSGDAYPYGTVKHIARNTPQHMKLYTNDAAGDSIMSLAVLNIKQNEDGTISFNVKENSKINEENRPEGALFYESFNLCSGAGGNDGTWSGTTADLIPDNEGWAGTQMYGSDRCARFGSNTRAGSATTPEVTVNENTILQFKAAPYTGEGTTLSLSSSNADITLSDASVTMVQGQWTDYKVKLTGTGTTKLTLRSNKRRFFLDEVAIVPDTQTGINEIDADGAKANQRIYTIDGRYVGKSIDGLRQGIYIIGGKKIVK